MARRILLICLFFSMQGLAVKAEVLGVYKTPSGTGWLERSSQGDLILHLQGNYHDMGYQQGKLLTKQCFMTMNGVKAYALRKVPFLPFSAFKELLYRNVYLKSEPFVPEKFKQEMQGLAEAGGVSVKDVAALHSLIYLASCSGTAAFGPGENSRYRK